MFKGGWQNMASKYTMILVEETGETEVYSSLYLYEHQYRRAFGLMRLFARLNKEMEEE